eukprot:Gb_23468 [translate_table: standard]
MVDSFNASAFTSMAFVRLLQLDTGLNLPHRGPIASLPLEPSPPQHSMPGISLSLLRPSAQTLDLMPNHPSGFKSPAISSTIGANPPILMPTSQYPSSLIAPFFIPRQFLQPVLPLQASLIEVLHRSTIWQHFPSLPACSSLSLYCVPRFINVIRELPRSWLQLLPSSPTDGLGDLNPLTAF